MERPRSLYAKTDLFKYICGSFWLHAITSIKCAIGSNIVQGSRIKFSKKI